MSQIITLTTFTSYWVAFFGLEKFLRHRWPTLSRGDSCHLANWALSSLQALLCLGVGVEVMRETRGDVMEASHWAAEPWGWAMLGYWLYDTAAMCLAHRQDRDGTSFVKANASLLLHHAFLVVLAFPAMTWWRGGRGDFFLGALLTVEASSPLVLLRSALHRLRLKDSALYLANGLAMIAVFATVRIAIFPFLFQAYASYAGLASLFHVPMAIPAKCTFACGVILAFNLYWFALMLRGAGRLLSASRKAH